MYILGVNAYHGDSSAALIKNGEVICAVEEERFNRIKHWSGFPENSIKFCLDHEGIEINQVDYITTNSNFYSNIFHKLKFILLNRTNLNFLISQLVRKNKKNNLRNQFEQIFKIKKLSPKIINIDHHLSHIASSYFCSQFNNSVSISVDGFGDFSSTVIASCKNNEIKVLSKVLFPHSLGVFYQGLTQYLGFKNYGDEYKVMGLAAYGEDEYSYKLKELVRIRDYGKFELNLKYFNHYKSKLEYNWDGGSPKFDDLCNNRKIYEYLDLPERISDQEINQKHRNLANSIQSIYEKSFFNIINYSENFSENNNLTLSGGCSMNSLANGKIYKNSKYENIYIPPSSGDAGGAIGSALMQYFRANHSKKHFHLNSSYLGPEFDLKYINQIIEDYKIRDNKDLSIVELPNNDLVKYVAKEISTGSVVGWFQNRMEFGPRALGNRSILSDPRLKNMKEILNKKIKKRESFRPFAPAILFEEVGNWFERTDEVPFMMQVFKFKKEKRDLVPAVVHKDGTGRLQTVSKSANLIYYNLIKEFYKITDIPILLNTSFNENEPIVCKPEEAMDCFIRTNMDLLIIGKYVIKRNNKIKI